ncbi:MAG: hypothetical protein ABW275_01310 [Hansschlegelia sp.]
MRLPKLVAVCAVVALCSVEGGGPASAQQTAPSPLELVYTPVTPCRAFDTRATAAINANQTRSFHVSGSADFPPQGGPAHGCGVPSYATAVSISLISVNQAAAGYLTAFAYNTPRPAAVSMYYQPNVTLANAIISPIRGGNLSIYSSKTTHVTGDVTGFYAPQITASVNEDGTLASSTPRVLGSRFDGNYYYLTIDRDVNNCVGLGAIAGSGNAFLSAQTYSNQVLITTYFLDANGQPQPATFPFRIVINC